MGAFYNVLLALFAATGLVQKPHYRGPHTDHLARSFLFGYDSGVMTDGE